MYMDMKKRVIGKRGWLSLEHAKFLMALEIEGKGRWKAISSHIDSKSSKQVQSHAQKYFLRQKQDPSTKKKTSIHDFTYTKLDEQFCGEYLRRLKYGDPQTYHLFYRYKMSRHQKNPLLYDPPSEGFEGYDPQLEGKALQSGMFMHAQKMMSPMGNMGLMMPYMNTQPMNMAPPPNRMNAGYQNKLRRVPILDPKGRELISRSSNPMNMMNNNYYPSNRIRNQHPSFRPPPFQSNRGQGMNRYPAQPMMNSGFPSRTFNNRRLNLDSSHQHYIQYSPNGDFQPVANEVGDVDMDRERPILNPIRNNNWRNNGNKNQMSFN